VRLLFTKSKLPLSWFIRWGTGQASSHFAIEFSSGLVFQSNLLGVGVEFKTDFFKEVTIVHEISMPLDLETEQALLVSALNKFDGFSYDYGAFIYDMVRMFLKRVFGVPLKPKNLWGASDRVLCVGLAKCLDIDGLPDWVRLSVRRVPDFDVYFPEDLYTYLENARLGRIVPMS
jgi:hypothetical protein